LQKLRASLQNAYSKLAQRVIAQDGGKWTLFEVGSVRCVRYPPRENSPMSSDAVGVALEKRVQSLVSQQTHQHVRDVTLDEFL
jgi:hypothetical protein